MAGAVATGTDFAVVFTLVSAALCSVPAATFVGCVAGAVTNFLINRLWAFQSMGAYGRQIRRYVGVSAASALLNTALVALLVTLAPVPYQVIWMVARALIFVGFNYPLHRYYVFTAGDAGRA